jgi:hypothetical protein
MRHILCLVAWLAVFATGVARADGLATPPEHRRGPEQTYLTYPEWFLVFSPAEYAEYVKTSTPTAFPFIGHIRQFWQGYRAVIDATRSHELNIGYHVMILVIGTSTTVEYALRAAYETLLGRLSELFASQGLSEEDRYGARVAEDYVKFIRELPWYEFDFTSRLVGLWRETAGWGPDPIRKWERKYALTTEYLIKAGYAWLIKLGTQASYETPLLNTAVVIDTLPEDIERELPKIQRLASADNEVLALLPRYDEFMHYSRVLAGRGVTFKEIAGNRSEILLSVLAPPDWTPATPAKVLFDQPVLTQAPLRRFVLVVPVASLGSVLNDMPRSDPTKENPAHRGVVLEHVFDF